MILDSWFCGVLHQYTIDDDDHINKVIKKSLRVKASTGPMEPSVLVIQPGGPPTLRVISLTVGGGALQKKKKENQKTFCIGKTCKNQQAPVLMTS